MNNLYIKFSLLILFICVLSSSLLGQIYCSSYGKNFDIGITSVVINTINESSRSYPYYTDNTSKSSIVTIGKFYNLTVKGDSWTNRDTKVMAWIDWNHDGDFNDSGESFDLGSIKKNKSNQSTTNSPLRIDIPVGAKVGETRIRISGKYNSYPTPCEVNFYGEVEDYTLNVVSSVVGQGFWFKTDAGVNGNVTSWTDQSGNGHTANNSGNISKVNNSLNFNPILNFSGVNRQFPVSGAASIQTFLVVNKTLATNNHLSGLIGMNGDKGVRLGKPSQSWKGNSNNDDWVNTSQGSSGRINGLLDANMVHDSQWHIASLTRSQALSGNYYLGGYYPGRSYSGDIAEVLAVSSAVTNSAQLETYLAIKYGITLGNTTTPVDYVNAAGVKVWNGVSVYQNNIAGIAREDSPYALHQKVSSTSNTTSASSSDVTMATIDDFTKSNQDASRTALGDGDYLLWGDNAGASSSWQDKDDYQTVARKWKLEKTGSIGATYFQINLNSYPNAVGDYLLIVDDDEDVSNGISNTYVLANTSGDLYSTSFTPPNGTSYFTIGYFSGSNITVADCLGAKTICDAVYDEPSPETMGLGGILNELPTGDCIPEEKNGIWYSFSPQNTVNANLKFRITPNVNTNDYDWAIFDMTNTTCEDLASIDISTSDAFVSGNTYGQNGWNGSTGADFDQGGRGDCNGPGTGNGPRWNDDVLVKPGHNYMLYVSNWSEKKDGYTISFDQGGSAIIYDDIPPELDGVVQACYGTNELKVDFTEILPCNSLDINKISLAIGGVSYSVTDITSSNCDSGGEGSAAYIFILDRPIFNVGSSNLNIEASGIADMCGNVNSVASNMSFTVYKASVALSVNKSPACIGENVIVTANGNGGFGAYIYEFYLNGTPIVSDAQYSIVGNQLSSNTFTDGDVVKVIVTDENACSVSGTEIKLSISSLPVNPTGLASQSYCAGETVASLVASNGSNAIDWYTVPNGGTALNSTDILATGTYYAEARDVSSGCVSSSRLTVTTVGDSEVPVINCLPPNVVWSEDFDSYSLFTWQATNSGTSWQGYYDQSKQHKAAVVGKVLEMKVQENSDVNWTTGYIDISAEESVQVSFNLSSWDASSVDGYIEFWARVDGDLGGTYQRFEKVTGVAANQVVNSPVFTGGKLELWIHVVKGSSVGIYYVDNINITSLSVKSVDSSQCFYTVQGNEFDATATDNCSLGSLTYSLTGATIGSGASLSGVKLEQGITTITWTATDASGNTSDCRFDVTIEDKVDPIAKCKDITIELDGTGNAGIVASDVDNGSSDNCSIASLSVTPNIFNCSNVGGNVVILKVTDSNGNSATCNANVTVTGAPDNSLSVLGDTKCDGEDATVKIQNSQIDVTYSLYIGSAQVGSSVNGTGADLNVTIPSPDLSIGNNVFTVRALKGACELDLLNSATILINSKPKPIGIFFDN
jgi:hypothetical protein